MKQHKRVPIRSRRMSPITGEQYYALLAQQRGVCGVCGESPNFGKLVPVTDYVRKRIIGLVCPRCALALEAMKLDVERIARALTFVQQQGVPIETPS